MAVRLEGYDTVYSGSHVVLIRPEWRPQLLESVLAGFSDIPAADRKVIPGRVEHFSFQPKGAPDRVIVRELARGGVAQFAGNLHFGLGRVMTELASVTRARKVNLHVPDIVACLATHALGPLYRFTFVVREIPGVRNLLVLLGSGLPPREHHRIISEVAMEIRRMHETGIYHGDLTVRNIMVGDGSVHFIDFDRATLRDERTPGLDIANLSRLNRSVEKVLRLRVSRIDRLRFLLKYVKDRAQVPEVARRVGSGMWRHRLWWAMTGAARS